MTQQTDVAIMGICLADTAYLAPRLPAIGETLMGSGFSLGPGGKGSNQAVAAARAGATTTFISKIGNDVFGELARKTHRDCGITSRVAIMDDVPTGAAFIYVNESSGENAIIVYSGASGTIDEAYVERCRDAIETARIFVTQLEQPVQAARAALLIAREAGVTTVFNPAPAKAFPDDMFAFCDYIAPNETETEALVGFTVDSMEAAARAGRILCERGAGAALITLGERGVYVSSPTVSAHVPALTNAPVVDTSGAGDAFIGGFAAALAEGKDVLDATKFGSATAGLSVTRRGTAAAMPKRHEIDALLKSTGNGGKGSP